MRKSEPRPKQPSAHDDFDAIRRRRDEILREEEKPPEEKPKGDPMLSVREWCDDALRAGCGLVPPTWKGLVDPEWMKEVWRIINEPCAEPSGVDFSEGEE